MNTDNMTISGETIDYGPCAFMEAFDPATVYSSIDHGGRYAYGNQPSWLSGTSPGSPRRSSPSSTMTRSRRSPSRWSHSAGSAGSTTPPGRPACGPSSACPRGLDDDDRGRRWSTNCSLCCSRATSTTPRSSARLGAAARGDAEPARGLFLDLAAFDAWVARWRALGPDADAMDRVNPVYIPRNHLVEEALDRRDRRRPGSRSSACWTP